MITGHHQLLCVLSRNLCGVRGSGLTPRHEHRGDLGTRQSPVRRRDCGGATVRESQLSAPLPLPTDFSSTERAARKGSVCLCCFASAPIAARAVHIASGRRRYVAECRHHLHWFSGQPRGACLPEGEPLSLLDSSVCAAGVCTRRAAGGACSYRWGTSVSKQYTAFVQENSKGAVQKLCETLELMQNVTGCGSRHYRPVASISRAVVHQRL